MVRVCCCLVFFTVLAAPLCAQSRFYGGGTIAADAGNHGSRDLQAFPAAGGFVGWRFHDTWSVEVHVDRGFARSAEREQLEIYGRSTLQDRAGGGWALLGNWKSRRRGRVGAAVTMGLSARSFATYTLSITKLIPDDPYPAKLGKTSVNIGAGWTGGVLFPITLRGQWVLAPEARVTLGLTESSFYAQFYPGVRLMWGF